MTRGPLLLAAVAASLAAPAAAQPAGSAALHRFLQGFFAGERASGSETRYASALVDLSGDGRAEAIVYVMGASFCGSGGCPMYVFTPAGTGYREVVHTTVTQTPIRVLDSRTRGWRDLAVGVSGGGARGHEALLAFNGRTYPRNPSVAPAARRGAPGRVVISDDERGRPLFDR